ncbi:sucrose phosphorylase [Cohaesibacter celericrescens]|uniref:Sucrose phosphorylase n=1 Tax=Cohaesibacter celericrescens TaxID=2067669 RepID=A0A2N5XPB3_9HYPH|nr:sucrose phosphorylase [Cohaesibacter celericrescens]PLW76324.1 sucrose phosphorylase [Cohaesibacter celericrescens]
MKNQVQLITYVDRLTGGTFIDLKSMLDGPLQGLFGTVHTLPFFTPHDGADAGFDPMDHTTVDPRLGDWSDVKALSQSTDVMADLIVNHVSADGAPFQDFLEKGDSSEFAPLFLSYSTIFPKGATEDDLLAIYRPRPGLPFTNVTLKDGSKRLIWTTFTPKQIDIDVHSEKGAAYLESILMAFARAGIKSIRLDAAGYAIKKSGTSCFMIPETFEFLEKLASKAKTLGMDVLVEIHSYYQDQIEISRKVDRVYDFALPPLILHALFTGDAKPLSDWLAISPRNAMTVLDTHDGIGVIDVGPHADGRPGLLDPDAIDALVKTIHQRTRGTSLQATGAAASNLDLYQVNSTYYDALGRRETDYLIARAVQFFAPGIPQVYYVGLFGAANDMDLLARTDVGRDINRHYFNKDEVSQALQTPMVQALINLIQFRNRHPAFNGTFKLDQPTSASLILEWRNGTQWAQLSVDFAVMAAKIRHSTQDAEQTFKVEPNYC